jgi:adenylate cyclase
VDGGRGRGGDPGNLADAHDYYALYLAAVGRHTEDGAEGRRARELDPLSLIILVDTAWVQYLARDYDQAIEINRKVLDMDAGPSSSVPPPLQISWLSCR